jgi:hypothetical protein
MLQTHDNLFDLSFVFVFNTVSEWIFKMHLTSNSIKLIFFKYFLIILISNILKNNFNALLNKKIFLKNTLLLT